MSTTDLKRSLKTLENGLQGRAAASAAAAAAARKAASAAAAAASAAGSGAEPDDSVFKMTDCDVN